MSLSRFTKTVATIYIGTPLSILGVIVNSLNLYLFYKDRVTCKSTRLLRSFHSCCDLGFLTLGTFYEPLSIYHPTVFTSSIGYPIIFYLLNTLELTRNWLVVLLAFERLFCIVKPLEFKQFWTPRAVAITVLNVAFSSCLLRIPSLLFMLGELRVGISETLTENCLFVHLFVDCVILSLLPECLMICVSVSTTILVKRWSLDRDKLGKQTPALGIVKAILIIFFLLTLPSVPATIANFYVSYTDIHLSNKVEYVLDLLSMVSNVCSVINSVVSFFIYIGFSTRYKEILISSLRLKKLKDVLLLKQFRSKD